MAERTSATQCVAEVLAHEQVGRSEHELTLSAPHVAATALPGQFVQLVYGEGQGPLMRRPFSVFKTDTDAGTIAIVYLTRGAFTSGLERVRTGDSVSLVGPLGNCFEIEPDPGAHHILVAGGVGAPPIFMLARQCVEKGIRQVTIINGARSGDLLVAHRELASSGVPYCVVTEDGTVGETGRVTIPLKHALDASGADARVYACGPTPMLRAVGAMCAERKVPCRVSVETVMPCGIGVCMGCVVKLRSPNAETGHTYVRACHEGPVFRSEEIIWE